MNLILASTSPRRQELLKKLRIPFQVLSPLFHEVPTDLPAAEEVLHFAEGKALSVVTNLTDALILAADTLVDCQGEKLGKPKDHLDALRILKRLSGKTHILCTAVVLFDPKIGFLQKHVEKVSVTFQELTDSEIQDYIATGEPMGKAGGYAIQGRARPFILKIEGDEEAAIGLPTKILRKWLMPDNKEA